MFEKRMKRDANGFYNVEVRELPLVGWQPLDGWCTLYISSDYQNVRNKLDKAPGKEVASVDRTKRDVEEKRE